MNIFIVGSGEIGRHLALSLAEEAHDITVIESSDRMASELRSMIDAKVICADGSSADTLVDADIAECDLFFAVTSDNNTNLVSCAVVFLP